MDGTIANFFATKNWKQRITAEDAMPYAEAAPLFEAAAMERQINRLKSQGYQIGIISYTPYDARPEFAEIVKQVKIEWLKKYFPYATEIILTTRETPKWQSATNHNSILIDDCQENRDAWKWGKTFNAYNADVVKFLMTLGK